MKLRARFYLLNYDFSPEYAEEHHNGEESENNRRYDWMDELEINEELIDFKVIESETFVLEGTINDENFSEEVPDMLIFETLSATKEKTKLAISNKLVENYDLDRGDELIELNVFMKKDEPLSNPIPGVYIASTDFPQKLIHAHS